jgi:hypothetical protein
LKHRLNWLYCPSHGWQINEYRAYSGAPPKKQEPELFDFALHKQKKTLKGVNYDASDGCVK